MINKILKILLIAVTLIIMLFTFSGCTQSERVSSNIRQQADNFNITRRIVVYNARTDALIFELIGNFSLQNNLDNELEIIVETEQKEEKQ